MSNESIGKKFYKAKLVPDEEGLMVVFDEFITVRETEHFYFAVHSSSYGAYNLFMNHGKFASEEAKKAGIAKAKKMVKRISKGCSRIAKETKELAVQELIMRKHHQITHLLRELAFCRAFIGKVKSIADLEEDGVCKANRWLMVPDTSELVREYFVFG